MEKSEPALVPEWLKSNGSSNLNQHSSSASFRTDDQSNVVVNRSKYAFGSGGYDSPRSVFPDSSDLRKSSCNGLLKNEKNGGYLRGNNSFGRRGGDRDWDGSQDWDVDCIDFRKKERWFMGDRRDRYSNAFGVAGNSYMEKGNNKILNRSQSMVSEVKGDLWSRRMDQKIGNNNDGGIAHKAAVERNLVSLGAEEKTGTPDISRAPSPSLSSSVQSFPIGGSAVIGDDGWTSALAEVPVVAESNNMIDSSVQQHASARLSTFVSSPTNGLNMAETLSQPPPRPHSAPQISAGTQRLEELAIKQSRQLVPLTSLVPKTSVHKSDKTKLKPAARSEMNLASKSGHHQLSSPHLVNHTSNGIHVKPDTAKSSHVGKLLVLKPTQERNGISSVDSPTNFTKVANNAPVVASPSVSTSLRSSSSPKYTGIEQKASSRPALYAPTMEKRPTVSQVRSRNDFFQLMRKKSATNLSSAPADSNHTLSTVLEGSDDSSVKVSTALISQPNDPSLSDPSCHESSTGNGATTASLSDPSRHESSTGNGATNPSLSDPSRHESSTGNGATTASLSDPSHHESSTGNGATTAGDSFEESCIYPKNREKSSIPVEAFHPNEEERAFLLSLGWEENAGEEEGLTEEEISAFYKKHMQLKPSMKFSCRFEQPKSQRPVTSHLDKL